MSVTGYIDAKQRDLCDFSIRIMTTKPDGYNTVCKQDAIVVIS